MGSSVGTNKSTMDFPCVETNEYYHSLKNLEIVGEKNPKLKVKKGHVKRGEFERELEERMALQYRHRRKRLEVKDMVEQVEKAESLDEVKTTLKDILNTLTIN